MTRLLVTSLTALVSAQPALCDSPLFVEQVVVNETELTFDAALTGTIHATDVVDIGFRQGGRIQEVLVSAGDAVTRGQALARTDSLQQEQTLRVAEASVAAANASQEQARQASDRAQAMLERGVGTRADLDTAAQDLASAQRSLAQADAVRDQAQRALDDTVMRAPTDAIVTQRNAEPGQIVGAAQAVISLASSTGREAVFQTPDSPLLQDAIGAPVSLIVIDAPDITMIARVSEIAPLVDPATGSVTVRARIDRPPTGVELLGAAVRGAVHFPAGKGISVPWTALTATADRPAVWVVGDDGRVTLTPVEVQRYSNRRVILSGGVQPGQVVVGAGSQLLYPGRHVGDAAGVR